jgi:hypothetical protein
MLFHGFSMMVAKSRSAPLFDARDSADDCIFEMTMRWLRFVYLLSVGLSLAFHGFFLLVYAQVGLMIAWLPVLKFFLPIAAIVIFSIALIVALIRGSFPALSFVAYFVAVSGFQGYMYWMTSIQAQAAVDSPILLRAGIPFLLLLPAALVIYRRRRFPDERTQMASGQG